MMKKIIKDSKKKDVLDVYQENGFASRKEYLKSLSEDYGVPLKDVMFLAMLLGRNEDFDGLISALEDIEEGRW